MSSKLKQARIRRQQLVEQEFAPTDESSIIRQQLKDGIEPTGWIDGNITRPVPERLPDPCFLIQEGGHLTPVIWYDLAWIGENERTITFHDSIGQSTTWDVVSSATIRNPGDLTLNPPRPGGWKSSGVIAPRIKYSPSAALTKLLGELTSVKGCRFVSITIHFNGGQEHEQLLFTVPTIQIVQHSIDNWYSIEQLFSGLLADDNGVEVVPLDIQSLDEFVIVGL
jgi:hypothetical protein